MLFVVLYYHYGKFYRCCLIRFFIINLCTVSPSPPPRPHPPTGGGGGGSGNGSYSVNGRDNGSDSTGNGSDNGSDSTGNGSDSGSITATGYLPKHM